jgi:hypothetical protein
MKYGYVCQLAERKNVKLRTMPTIDASLVKSPTRTRIPMISSVATVSAPTNVACSAACIKIGRIGDPLPYEMICAPI